MVVVVVGLVALAMRIQAVLVAVLVKVVMVRVVMEFNHNNQVTLEHMDLVMLVVIRLAHMETLLLEAVALVL